MQHLLKNLLGDPPTIATPGFVAFSIGIAARCTRPVWTAMTNRDPDRVEATAAVVATILGLLYLVLAGTVLDVEVKLYSYGSGCPALGGFGYSIGLIYVGVAFVFGRRALPMMRVYHWVPPVFFSVAYLTCVAVA